MSVPTLAKATEFEDGVWLAVATLGAPDPPFASKLTVKMSGVYRIAMTPDPPRPPAVLLVLPFVVADPLIVGSQALPPPPPPPVLSTP